MGSLLILPELFPEIQQKKVKVLLVGGAFLFLQFLIIGCGFTGAGVFLIILLIVDAAAVIFIIRKADGLDLIMDGLKKISDGELQYKIKTDTLTGKQKVMAEYINNIGSGLDAAVENSLKKERMQTELITNVSHDIKTPLTSIINYVNLIKLEHIDNERVNGFISGSWMPKSQRLKQLTEDLVETSRITSGNVKLDMQKIDLVELIYQTAGEFNEKFEAKELTIVTKLPKTEVMILADGRQLYRVIENLYNNVAKYALEKTRVYVDVHVLEEKVTFSIKNVSERSLALENSNAGDLTERFIRGDASRTTEGSGLGAFHCKESDTAYGRHLFHRGGRRSV